MTRRCTIPCFRRVRATHRFRQCQPMGAFSASDEEHRPWMDRTSASSLNRPPRGGLTTRPSRTSRAYVNLRKAGARRRSPGHAAGAGASAGATASGCSCPRASRRSRRCTAFSRSAQPTCRSIRPRRRGGERASSPMPASRPWSSPPRWRAALRQTWPGPGPRPRLIVVADPATGRTRPAPTPLDPADAAWARCSPTAPRPPRPRA